ncbi:MAG: ABC transporter permease [Chloroflexi bacterium]|nr:MAG: ABC transporter permease [Chloroflexota bacterium]
MLMYVLRRLGWTVLILLLITVITFVLSRVVPANPVVMAAGLGATTEQVAEVRRVMGLDEPLPVQYERYMQGLARLDLTFELMLISFALYVLIAIPLGVMAAMRPGGLTDALIRTGSMLTSAVPVFWLAMILQVVFFARFGWLPSGGRLDVRASPPPLVTGFFTIDSLLAADSDQFLAVLKHLILPVTAIVLSLLAVGVRLTRATMLQELQQAYARTARSKGLKQSTILFRHVLKNALNPVISMLGIQLGYLLAWIILVETIFQCPGIGLYAYESFQGLDYSPIMALTLVFSCFFVVVNLITDLTYPVLDPRIKLR